MSNNTRSSNPAAFTTLGKTGYEASVIGRAMERAGRNPHLKGHIHEVLTQDALNVRNLFNGQTTAMTRSTNATVVDLVTTKGGKVVERLQLKDTVSASSIDKLVRQVADGKYRTAQLKGTEEATKLFNAAAEKAGVAKRMTSTGVSTRHTTSLAQRAGATGSGTLGGAVQQAARSGGAAGAAIGAGIEVIQGVSDLMDGRRDAVEVAGSVARAGAKGYATGAAASAAATAGGAVVTAGLTSLGAGAGFTALATVAAPVAIAVGVGYVVSEVWDSIFG